LDHENETFQDVTDGSISKHANSRDEYDAPSGSIPE
jgi:hypothetical protein